VRARESFSRRWRRGREHHGRRGRKRGAPDAISARKTPGRTRTPSRTVDETTLPRMTGDAGLLMSTTTSESDRYAVT